MILYTITKQLIFSLLELKIQMYDLCLEGKEKISIAK